MWMKIKDKCGKKKEATKIEDEGGGAKMAEE